MGLKEDAIALADELGSYEDGDCEECIAYGQPECKGHLSCAEIIARYSARKVREAVERDAEDVTTVSAYDLLPDEDRKAIAWVREHGGLDMAASRFESGEIAADMLWGKGHGRIWTTDEFEEEISKRLMPEGMEWPKVDGKPVDFKTCYALSVGALEAVSIYNNMACEVMGHDGIIKPASEIHAVVLAADGEPLEVGQTVYAPHYGYMKCTVLAIEWVVDGYLVEVENEGGHKFRQTPDEFIHQRPVFAADGEPLEVGQTVYGTRYLEPVEIVSLRSKEYDGVHTVKCKDRIGFVFYAPDDLTHQRPVLDADGVLCREGDEVWEVRSHRHMEIVGTNYCDHRTGEPLILCDGDDAVPIPATCVTHAKPEPPDTWERIEEDVMADAKDYCESRGISPEYPKHSGKAKCEDLVRRCRALAERGEL